MTELALPGCRITPLGGYLAALGLLRAVTRLLDCEATGRWERQQFVLGSRCESLDELVDELLTRFEPEAIVSPWNAGSGFAENGKNVTAERALHTIRQSDDHRLARLKEAVHAGDRVVALGQGRGWGGKGDDLWDKARKREVLGLCRNEFPDHALPWLDAAVALGQDDDPAYSRLLGTGGNFGVRHQLGEEGGGTAEGYGSVPFHRTEWTAKTIVASFVVDAELLRSYGLPQPLTELLQALALWEIRRFLAGGLRLRTACDLEIVGEVSSRHKSTLPELDELTSRIAELIPQGRDVFGDGTPLTVEWSGKKA
jgi:hypothetical protein